LGRILGLDLGDKTIGIALSDEMKWTAQAVKTLRREGKKTDFPAIIDFARQHEVEEIVIGLPKNMNNSLGEQAEKVLKFSRQLEGRLGSSIKVTLWDERLSTAAAEKTLISADVTRKKRKKVIDTMAAVFILQGYLDSLSF
jgi:putative Holliday junction resolvase